jgi:hypothetical protein
MSKMDSYLKSISRLKLAELGIWRLVLMAALNTRGHAIAIAASKGDAYPNWLASPLFLPSISSLQHSMLHLSAKV